MSYDLEKQSIRKLRELRATYLDCVKRYRTGLRELGEAYEHSGEAFGRTVEFLIESELDWTKLSMWVGAEKDLADKAEAMLDLSTNALLASVKFRDYVARILLDIYTDAVDNDDRNTTQEMMESGITIPGSVVRKK